MLKSLTIIVAFYFCCSFAKKLPPDFQICKHEESEKLSACLKSAVSIALRKLNHGIPSLHIPPVDPLETPQAILDQGAGAIQATLNFTNIKVYGLNQATIDDVLASATSTTFNMTLEASLPEMRLEGDYTVTGRVLTFPINGDGRFTIKFENPKTTLGMFCETYKKKGTDYCKVQNSTADLRPEKLVMHFDNLFNGDKTITDQINIAINENWEELYKELKGSIDEIVSAVIGNYIEAIFSQVPTNDLLPQ